MRSGWDRVKLWLKPDLMGWLILGLGVVLRLRQYLANRSFWHDEATLALNLVHRSFSGLTRPLDFAAAPVGFLFIEKFLMVLMGNRDYILRLFPLFSGLLAIYLVYLIARKQLGPAGLFAVLACAICWSLIYYSSELKQYSSDTLFALLLVYLSIPCLKESARAKDFLLLGAAGLIAIWISHPSVFVLAGIGLVLLFTKLAGKTDVPLAWILGLGAAWAAALGATYVVSLRHLVSDQSLQNYWRHGFMPLPPWRHLDWLAQTYLALLEAASRGAGHRFPTLIWTALLAIGIVSFLLRDRNTGLIIILPFFFVSVAAALQRYPLRGRLVLFLVPLLLLIAAEGLGRFFGLLSKGNRGLAMLACGALIPIVLWTPVNSAVARFRWPVMADDIKPVMEYVQRNRQPDDVVYVYHGARPSFDYYAPFYGLDTGNVITGPDRADALALKQFYNQVNRLRANNRVWFIFSHIVDCGGCSGDMEAFYIQYLDQLGTAVDHFQASHADVYLYNLNP